MGLHMCWGLHMCGEVGVLVQAGAALQTHPPVVMGQNGGLTRWEGSWARIKILGSLNS